MVHSALDLQGNIAFVLWDVKGNPDSDRPMLVSQVLQECILHQFLVAGSVLEA